MHLITLVTPPQADGVFKKLIKKENFTLESIIARYSIASRRIKNSEEMLKKNDDDEGIYISAYAELYNSFRILCEIMLALCGYRPAGKGHHESAISTIRLTLEDGILDTNYIRLIKIGRKRTAMEHGGSFDMSSIEMETMLKDVQLVLKKVKSEIDKKTNEKSV